MNVTACKLGNWTDVECDHMSQPISQYCHLNTSRSELNDHIFVGISNCIFLKAKDFGHDPWRNMESYGHNTLTYVYSACFSNSHRYDIKIYKNLVRRVITGIEVSRREGKYHGKTQLISSGTGYKYPLLTEQKLSPSDKKWIVSYVKR